MTIFSAAVLLVLVMDPFGNIGFFMAALKSVESHRRQKIIVRELLIALLVMILFLFTGQYVLSALQVSGSALTSAGGVLLFLIALKMIFPITGQTLAEEVEGEPFVFPMAIPYIARPSALATVLFIVNREPERWPEWLAAVFGAWLVSGLIILLSGPLSKALGEKGLIAVERLMGMVLVTIAIQMLMNGIAQFISNLGMV